MNTKDISEKYKSQVTVQDYSPTTRIEGVEIIDVKEFADCGGSFSELIRVKNGQLTDLSKLNLKQVNYSVLEPGAVKAFHLHYHQSELWFIPPKEKLLVGMIDTRKNSKTKDVSMRFVMGMHKPRLLYIPKGVAHGISNPYMTRSTMIYFADQNFDINKPDEQRLPWDILGAEFWQIQKG